MRARCLFCVLLAVGCSPSMPTEQDARAALERHSDEIKALDKGFWAAAKQTPYGQHGRNLPCMVADRADQPPAGTEEKVRAALAPLTARIDCEDKQRAHAAAQVAAVDDIKSRTAPALFEASGMIGGEARLSVDNANFSLGAKQPYPPGSKTGTVEADDGVVVGDKKLGYGLFSTFWADESGPHGEDAYVRAIEVKWERKDGPMTLKMGVILPLDP